VIRGITPGLPTDARDHKAWLEHWGKQLVAAIRDAQAHPEHESHDDFRLRYAISCARIAHGRAMKVKPSLKIRA
jgi:hypothetical protein